MDHVYELKHCQKCNSYKKDEDNYCSHCGMKLVWYLPKELEVWVENHDYKGKEYSYKQNWYYPNEESVGHYRMKNKDGTVASGFPVPKQTKITDSEIIYAILKRQVLLNYPHFTEGPITEELLNGKPLKD